MQASKTLDFDSSSEESPVESEDDWTYYSTVEQITRAEFKALCREAESTDELMVRSGKVTSKEVHVYAFKAEGQMWKGYIRGVDFREYCEWADAAEKINEQDEYLFMEHPVIMFTIKPTPQLLFKLPASHLSVYDPSVHDPIIARGAQPETPAEQQPAAEQPLSPDRALQPSKAMMAGSTGGGGSPNVVSPASPGGAPAFSPVSPILTQGTTLPGVQPDQQAFLSALSTMASGIEAAISASTSSSMNSSALNDSKYEVLPGGGRLKKSTVDVSQHCSDQRYTSLTPEQYSKLHKADDGTVDPIEFAATALLKILELELIDDDDILKRADTEKQVEAILKACPNRQKHVPISEWITCSWYKVISAVKGLSRYTALATKICLETLSLKMYTFTSLLATRC